VVIEKGHKDEFRIYGSYLDACIFVVNQDQVFEAGFQVKFKYGWGKVELKVDWVSDEEINRDV
jgi:hypothetical protein